MKVELEKTFPMPATTDAAWEFLQNIEGVAGCMPGAKITERIDATHYKGTISVRVGPAGMSFKGEIEVQGLFAATRTLHLVGKGSDTSGTSGASMDLVARIDPGATEGTSNLVGKSEVTMSGKAAAFGGRMMGSVADQILKQFAGNFAAQVQARAEAPVATAGSGGSAPAFPVATAGSGGSAPAFPVATADSGGSAPAFPIVTAGNGGLAPAFPAAAADNGGSVGAFAAAATGDGGSAAAAPATAPTRTANTALPLDAGRDHAPDSTPSTPPPTPANEINALALFWAILRDWFRGLFRRKPA
jgi:carbon monoxide dehydrogenase subunit G